MGDFFMTPRRVVGVKLKDKAKLLESQSGGAFTAIAEHFLKNGGIVYGCSMNPNLVAAYKRINNAEELILLKGSKYIQAKMGNIIRQVLEDLDSNNIVLFSGTPCNIAALKKVVYLHKNKEKLYTVDIICHGVPSPLVLKTYLNELELRAGSNISQFIFRDKLKGWHRHMEKIIYKNGLEEIREDYTKIFYTNLTLRPSCGECKFACTDRVADFTVGDFWGIQNISPQFNDDRGVSLMFLNSDRAINIFKEISDGLEVLETDIAHAMQTNLKASCIL